MYRMLKSSDEIKCCARSINGKKVRLATIEDCNLIYEMLRDDLEEQGILHRFEYSKESFKDLIFGTKPKATFLILEIDEKPAGFANYSIDFRNITVNSLANLYVNDLFVKKAFRRRKGATLLMDKLKEIAEIEQCGRIELLALAENTVAIDFYEKFLNINIISDKLHYMRLELDT